MHSRHTHMMEVSVESMQQRATGGGAWTEVVQDASGHYLARDKTIALNLALPELPVRKRFKADTSFTSEQYASAGAASSDAASSGVQSLTAAEKSQGYQYRNENFIIVAEIVACSDTGIVGDQKIKNTFGGKRPACIDEKGRYTCAAFKVMSTNKQKVVRDDVVRIIFKVIKNTTSSECRATGTFTIRFHVKPNMRGSSAPRHVAADDTATAPAAAHGTISTADPSADDLPYGLAEMVINISKAKITPPVRSHERAGSADTSLDTLPLPAAPPLPPSGMGGHQSQMDDLLAPASLPSAPGTASTAGPRTVDLVMCQLHFAAEASPRDILCTIERLRDSWREDVTLLEARHVAGAGAAASTHYSVSPSAAAYAHDTASAHTSTDTQLEQDDSARVILLRRALVAAEWEIQKLRNPVIAQLYSSPNNYCCARDDSMQSGGTVERRPANEKSHNIEQLGDMLGHIHLERRAM